MREILFRGKTLYATGEQKWVYGNLCHDGMKKGGWCIEIEPGRMIGVDPNTVGQYTGNIIDGVKAFEGDIATFDFQDYNGGDHIYTLPISYAVDSFGFAYKSEPTESEPDCFVYLGEAIVNDDEMKILGNVFDNPELIPHD